jgi:hypothetical protein
MRKMKFQLIRWIVVITIICAAILVVGYRLAQTDSTVAAAPALTAPAPVKAVSLGNQATHVEQVALRGAQAQVEPTVLFNDQVLGYHLSYPANWQVNRLSAATMLFESDNGVTQVKVEAAGVLPADGLSPFVTRSLVNQMVINRQLLTVYGQPAERVMTFADTPGGQLTTFYVQTNASVYVITGQGQQRAIEQVARSFNAPQAVAQR